MLNREKSIVVSLTKPGEYRDPSRIRWSADGKYIAFDFYLRGTLSSRGVAIVDVGSGQIQIVSDNNKSCRVGGWTNQSSELLFDCYVPNGDEAGFFQYSVGSQKLGLFIKFAEVGGFESQFNIQDSQLGFIGDKQPITVYDIWVYDASNGNLVKLTDDGHAKAGLLWYARN